MKMSPSALKSTLHLCALNLQSLSIRQSSIANCCAFRRYSEERRQQFLYFPHLIFLYPSWLYSISMHRVQPILYQLIFITFFISPPVCWLSPFAFSFSPAQPFESEPRSPAVGAAEYFGKIYMRNIRGGAHFSNGHGVRRNGGGW